MDIKEKPFYKRWQWYLYLMLSLIMIYLTIVIVVGCANANNAKQEESSSSLVVNEPNRMFLDDNGNEYAIINYATVEAFVTEPSLNVVRVFDYDSFTGVVYKTFNLDVVHIGDNYFDFTIQNVDCRWCVIDLEWDGTTRAFIHWSLVEVETRTQYVMNSFVIGSVDGTDIVDPMFAMLNGMAEDIINTEKIYSDAYDNGYANGYSDGIQYNNGDNYLATALIAVVQEPFNMIYRFLNFNLLGINILGLASAIITAMLVIVVIKKVTK